MSSSGTGEEKREVKTLEEICILITDGSHYSPASVKQGYFMASVKDMTKYGFDFSNCRRISEEDYNILVKNGCKPMIGDILIGKDGARYLDDVFVFRQNVEVVVLSSIAILRVDRSSVLPEYLYYFLADTNIKTQIKNNYGSGSAIPRMVLRDFKRVPISFPQLNRQKGIVDTLSCLDDMIELNNRTNQILEEIAQAIFKRWFVDFEFPNEDGQPYKSSGGEMVDSELGKIPKGWRTGYVNEICKVIYGAPFKSSLFNKVKNGWPLIRIRDLKTFNPQFYTNEQNPRTEFVQPGDILVGMDAEFRPCIWKGDKGVLNQRVCKFEPRLNEVCRFFVYSIIKPHLEFIEGFKVGTTVSHIGKGDIDKIQLIIPSNEALIMFKNTVEPLYLDIINNCKQNRILEPIRDSLLPKLMSGEIRVPIEEVV